MLKLNDQLLIAVNGKAVQGNIVGIDSYQLENFEGKKHKWLSYTLVSDKKGEFSRYWITDWKKSGWVLWTGCPKKKSLSSLKMVTDRSGITNIEFSGDQGVSTPFAAVAIYQLENGEYYAMERFTASQVMFFCGRPIKKPKVI